MTASDSTPEDVVPKPTHGTRTCPACEGGGYLEPASLCVSCGYRHEVPCPRCEGRGYVGPAEIVPKGGLT